MTDLLSHVLAKHFRNWTELSPEATELLFGDIANRVFVDDNVYGEVSIVENGIELPEFVSMVVEFTNGKILHIAPFQNQVFLTNEGNTKTPPFWP